MIVNLIPNKEMRELLQEFTKGRKVLHIACEPTPEDIRLHNKRKALNLGKNNIPVMCVTNRKPYKSIKEASIALGLDPGAISRCINSKQESTQGYKFQLI